MGQFRKNPVLAVRMESQPGKAEGKKELSTHHWMQTNKQANIVILLTEYLQTKGFSL